MTEALTARAPRANALRTTAALAMAGCFWGTGFFFGKIDFLEMTVSENATFRFLFACIPLIPFAFRKNALFRERNWPDIWLFAVATVIGFPVQFLIQFKGLQLTSVSHASLIVGTLPVMVALASVAFLHERLGRIEWIVLLLSPVGATLIALSSKGAGRGSSGPTLAGDSLVLLSMATAAIFILLSKRLLRKYDSIEMTTWMILIGTALLVIWSEAFQPLRFHFSGEVWGAAAAQGLLATAGAYLCWNWGLARIPASRAGVFLNLEPLVGSCLGVFLLNETLGALALVGGAMILGPAVYFSRKG
ncbi:MAG: DMT family transporter [Candidatus Acidiferrales bacterium]